MASVSTPKIRAATAQIIKRAAKAGTLGDLTPRIVRRKVEEELAIDSEVLEDEKYRKVVKEALNEAMAQAKENSEAEDEPEPEPPKKKAAPKEVKPVKRKAEGKPATPKAGGKKSDTKADKKPRGKAQKAGRSASVVPSSDEEEQPSPPKPASKAKPTSQVKSPPKSSKKATKDEPEESEGDEPPKKRRKKKPASEEAHKTEKVSAPASRPAESTSKLPGDTAGPSTRIDMDIGDKSESELSVLIDEEPKVQRKKRAPTSSSKATTSKGETKKRKGKEVEELSKDDQEIKRLKSFVLACGVRKVWAREFKDMDKPSQIQKLRQMLSDLGMRGRLSLEQAKGIKAKRELAQELQDVQEFEKSVVSGPSGRPSRSRTKQSAKTTESDDEMSDGFVKPTNAARKKIMAFLEDQSDEE
ncbi:hypothetical protein NLI96_g7177 [Meripilus lineatus]|uniref:Uncharacterized protein n=1 Tax=Meripilus lineatus TaxID=2056292 RepID=A0AAD5UZN2_9APHY|nr:hypothetical protein NLI96_g7177 [Physisporinus lineatus]